LVHFASLNDELLNVLSARKLVLNIFYSSYEAIIGTHVLDKISNM